MPIVHPAPLQPGDRVALVSPSGPVPEPIVVDQCREVLEKMGYSVWVGPSAHKFTDYLAGWDEERAADLNQAFRDREIRAVFCTRGGYGAGRLLRMLDYEAMRRNPKIFAGFSDLTAVHAALAKQCNLATFHSTTLAAAFVYESDPLTPEAREVYMKQIVSTEPVGSIREAMNWTDPIVYHGGKAEGTLVGGNLSVFGANVGTPYLPDPEGKILFLEDVGEEPYRLDRYVNQLDMSGYLGRVRGVILGQFTDAEPSNPKREKIDVVMPRLLAHLKVPVLANFPAGHVGRNAGLPLGCRVVLDADGGDVVLEEALCG
ncbi:MAG: muramoyltetrapeptide carboxypeptidase [Candidatus Sumerlaeota bacterium]|nr:muramoyltetrapeptide carboxypeptidase [Candidatus Sumerlaeota bacterium]